MSEQTIKDIMSDITEAEAKAAEIIRAAEAKAAEINASCNAEAEERAASESEIGRASCRERV